MGFSISGDYAPMSMKTVGVESAAAAAHCTPDPVEVKTNPEVPVELFAVKEPVKVRPEIVGLVAMTTFPLPV